MRRNKIHDAEGQTFDLRQSGNRVRIFQCAMCFDQDMDWQISAAICVAIDQADRILYVSKIIDFGNNKVSKSLRGMLQDDLYILLEKFTGDIVHACTDATEQIFFSGNQAAD